MAGAAGFGAAQFGSGQDTDCDLVEASMTFLCPAHGHDGYLCVVALVDEKSAEADPRLEEENQVRPAAQP